jgi:hypothetical protein
MTGQEDLPEVCARGVGRGRVRDVKPGFGIGPS